MCAALVAYERAELERVAGDSGENLKKLAEDVPSKFLEMRRY